MAERPINFSMSDQPTDDEPMDLSAVNLSGPIDLSTFKRKNITQEEHSTRRIAVQDGPPKQLDISVNQCTDVHKVMNFFSRGISLNTELRTLQLPFGAKPINVANLLPSPTFGDDSRFKGIGDMRIKLPSPVTSPTLCSPPIIQGSSSPTNSLGSVIQPSYPLLQSPGFDTLTDKRPNKRHSNTRLFNVLSKKYFGDVDCPARPGHRQGSNCQAGDTTKKDGKEEDPEYREKRAKNNLAARKSRDKRKKRGDLFVTNIKTLKQESLDIVKEIFSLQDGLVERGYKDQLPYRDEVEFIYNDLYMYS